MSALDAFSPATQAWFRDAFSAPTEAQLGAWSTISQGRNALVVAPTGSGKTLSAFLWSIDKLATSPAPPKRERCRVLYVSPLKALAVDVERNLRAPLAGIRRTAASLGQPTPDISVAIRTGDTAAPDRRRIVTSPPDILITTPESLFLMLTSRAREALLGVETVIVDEVHAVAGTKRGAHLALSLERLDAMLPEPAQRIGLSATVRPVEEIARFLGGAQPVEVVAPAAAKRWDLRVVVPVEDMGDLAAEPAPGSRRGPSTSQADSHSTGADDEQLLSIWPHLEEQVFDLVAQHRSTIVFANARRVAERLTARLNEIAAERDGAILDAGRPPAQVMGQSGQSYGATTVIARAHHGSVSKEQRAIVEDDLKTGRLRCVVATSSLELGIDMGSVDLVVQIESPPSVASALQRVGRAGHQVGETSRGVFLPKHRADLVHTAVTVQRMRQGAIEALRVPSNPLDVLAQQIVAATALDTWEVDELFDLVCRAAPFSGLARSVFDATLDLLSGRYPSDEFAELRPRVVWDRIDGTVTGRPGSQRLAVTSGGTIPDRGLFAVFMVGGGRVGELDEEMVYESRVGDVFALGATSWRIEQITHDRVLVSPAPGRPGRLPFWHGDQLGRPAELGRAIGEFMREVGELPSADAEDRCRESGLDEYAAANLVGFLDVQQRATRLLPSDRTILVERFHDELGDWRVVVHSPYGNQVHAPWALLIGQRLQEQYGIEAQAMSADDGIVLRVPDSDREPPGAEILRFDPAEIEALVAREVTGSALFASRFRECAARALLLPRRDPRRRSPLWQQRKRSAQLLQVVSQHPDFPIVLEAVRECLQDVYDVPALVELSARISAREIEIAEITTPTPSPFAQSLLMDYVATFIYDGDAPLAERRAAALTLDQGLLAELLGHAELRELLDPDVLAEVEAELQLLTPDRLARDEEDVADLLRRLGPLTTSEVRARSTADPRAWLGQLAAAHRVVAVSIAGQEQWAAIEDVSRLRDALGVPVPAGTPAAFAEAVADPLGDLVSRFARTHGPFAVADVAARFGLGVAVADHALERLAAAHRVIGGEFRPLGTTREWCDAEVLRRLRQRSLAVLRKEVEPVEQTTLGRFVPVWQGVSGGLRGVDGLVSAIEQLAGCPVPASALESLVLPARVDDYSPAMLDELTTTGEVLWAGHTAIGSTDGWISLHLADTSALSLPLVSPPADVSPLESALLDSLGRGGAYFVRQLADTLGEPVSDVEAALWRLVWSGQVTNDTMAPLRLLGGDRPARPSASRSRVHRARVASTLRAATVPSRSPGRWSILPVPESDPTRRAHALAESLLARHGVVTRGAVAAEQVTGGFAAVYRTLATFEEAGKCRRGYFVEGLGAAQFAAPGAVDRLRSLATSRVEDVVALAATDPANPYGAALPWPASELGHRPGRKAGAIVVIAAGALALYAERGARTLLTYTDDFHVLKAATTALAEAAGRLGHDRLTVEKIDGIPVLGPESKGDVVAKQALESAGFIMTPQGMRIRLGR